MKPLPVDLIATKRGSLASASDNASGVIAGGGADLSSDGEASGAPASGAALGSGGVVFFRSSVMTAILSLPLRIEQRHLRRHFRKRLLHRPSHWKHMRRRALPKLKTYGTRSAPLITQGVFVSEIWCEIAPRGRRHRIADQRPKYAMVVRTGEAIQELPVEIITHATRKRPSASNPRQPRPLKARFLPSWNSKSCGVVMLGSPWPPSPVLTANHIAHWRPAYRRSLPQRQAPQHRILDTVRSTHSGTDCWPWHVRPSDRANCQACEA
jgi:hypothetical protein